MATYYVDGAAGDDSNLGTSPGAGNAWATIDHALATIVTGDLVYVKASAVYTTGSGLTLSVGTYNDKVTRIVGYTTTPGDGGRTIIRATANVNGFTVSGSGCSLENLDLDGDGTGLLGVNLSGSYHNVLCNSIVRNWTSGGVQITSLSGTVLCSEVTGCSGGPAVYLNSSSGCAAFGCNVHDNTGVGVQAGNSGATVCHCRIAGNTSDGIQLASYGTALVANNTIHNNGRDGIRAAVIDIQGPVVNNVITNNGGYGLNWSAAGTGARPDVNFNAFRGNTSGARNVVSAGANDVALSGDPYTAVESTVLTLNNTAGAGAACRAAAYPGLLVEGETGYLDLGALQHQDAGGGVAGMLYAPNLEGL